MNKKILISLSVIGAVAALAIGGTIAYFSDVETSTGNTFTAGSLDLTIDSKATYNGVTASYGNWGLKDLGAGDLFFNLADVKPGDYGEDTVSLHVNNNDACGFVKITRTTDADGTCTEPEGSAENKPTAGLCDADGELDENVIFTIWSDMGTNQGTGCENVLPGDNKFIPNCGDIQLTTGTLDAVENWGLGKLAGNSTTYYGIGWTLPASVGNIVQSDSFTADVEFTIKQFRNQYNDSNHPCPVGELVTRVYSSPLNYSGTGWGGWSCPAGTSVVGGGVSSPANPTLLNSLAWKPGASVGSYTYPTTPFGYTYGAGEEGWIVQNNGTPAPIVLYVDCMAN